ncbi:hypothetical protein ACFQ4J_06460 [Laceyella tengchongensis]|jgi:hypothetical protein
MNKTYIYMSILAVCLTFSLIGNMTQFNKINELEHKIKKLTEQDKAQAVAKQFVLTLMDTPTPENKKKLRSITTQKAQQKIFANDMDLEDESTNGIKQRVTIEKTYFNRLSLNHVNILIQFRVYHDIGNGQSTAGMYEMNMNLTSDGQGVWKVDSYDFEIQNEKNLDEIAIKDEE